MKRRRLWVLGAGAIAAVMLSVAACGHRAHWSDGERWFYEANTTALHDWSEEMGEPPTPEDEALLARYQPHVIIAPDGLPPVNFYEEYLPQTVVRGPWRTRPREYRDLTREQLKSIERDRRYYLDYRGKPPCRGAGCADFEGTLYGRVFRETMRTVDGVEPAREMPIVVLKYNAVFEASGLPAGVSGVKALGASILGNVNVWHEGDIHGAVQLAFREGEEKPFAVLLAQHNHFHTYLVGRDLQWPDDDRLPVCYAQRSNEPYLCTPGTEPAAYPAVGDPRQVRYLILGGKPPLLGANDLAYGLEAGGTEVECSLEFLPEKDPLYVSWIPLGDRKKLLGIVPSFVRCGPPGMDMNTIPGMDTYGEILQGWYFPADRKRAVEAVEVVEAVTANFYEADLDEVIRHNGASFWTDLDALRARAETADP